MKTCKRCGDVKDKSLFTKDSRRSSKLSDWCKACHSEYQKLHGRSAKLMQRYGITVEAYNRLLAEQNWSCPICNLSWFDCDSEKYWPVDHDHKTGKVRAILCDTCNRGLSVWDDNTEIMLNAVQYLKDHRE